MFRNQIDLRTPPFTRYETQTIYAYDHRYNNPLADIYTNIQSFEKLTPSFGLMGYMFDSYARQDLINIEPSMFWTTVLSRIRREVYAHPLDFIDFFIANNFHEADVIPRTRPCIIIHDMTPSPSTNIDILNTFNVCVHKLNLNRIQELCNVKFSTDTGVSPVMRVLPVLQMLNVFYDFDVVRPVLKPDEYKVYGSATDFQELLDFTDLNNNDDDPKESEEADHQTLVDALDDLFDLFSSSPNLQRYFLKANIAIQKLHDSFEEFFIPSATGRGASRNRIYGSVCDLYDTDEGSMVSEFDGLDVSQFMYRNIADGTKYVSQGSVIGSIDTQPVYGLLNYSVFKV